METEDIPVRVIFDDDELLQLSFKKNGYRDVFFAENGFGPYRCLFCDELVFFSDVTIHHEDEDRTNNIPSNLKATHDTCHRRHHGLQKDNRCKSENCDCGRHDRKKIDDRVARWMLNPNRGSGNAMFAAAGTAILKERVTCDVCGLESNRAGIWRHTCPGSKTSS